MLRWRVQTCRPVLVGRQPGSALPPRSAWRAEWRAWRGAVRRARDGAGQEPQAPVILSVLVLISIIANKMFKSTEPFLFELEVLKFLATFFSTCHEPVKGRFGTSLAIKFGLKLLINLIVRAGI